MLCVVRCRRICGDPIIAKISTALAHSEPLMLAQNGVVVAQAEPHTALSTPMVTIMLLAFFFLPFSFTPSPKINVYPIVQKAIHGLVVMLMNKIWRPLQVVSLVRCVRFSNHFIPLREVLDPAPLGDKGIQTVIKGATKLNLSGKKNDDANRSFYSLVRN